MTSILMGTESAAIRVHLETCRPCQQLSAAALDVVVRLQKLPYEKPSPGFADRVMAKVTVTRQVAVLAPTPRSWARAAALFLVIMGGMGSSVIWSLANQVRIEVLRQSLVSGVDFWFSTALPLLLSRVAAHPLVEAALGSKIGVMICFDWYYPEAARTLAMQGADIICHPSNLVLPNCPDSMPVRCLENRVFAVTYNRIGSEARGGKERLTYIGQSEVVTPQGVIQHRASRDQEELTVVEIEPAQARNKALNRYNDLLRDRRTSLYKM